MDPRAATATAAAVAKMTLHCSSERHVSLDKHNLFDQLQHGARENPSACYISSSSSISANSNETGGS